MVISFLLALLLVSQHYHRIRRLREFGFRAHARMLRKAEILRLARHCGQAPLAQNDSADREVGSLIHGA